MRNAIILTLSFATLLFSIENGLIYLNFKMNQEWIATRLCVKKAEVENDCQGMCQLKTISKKKEAEKQTGELPVYTELNKVLYAYPGSCLTCFELQSSANTKLQIAEKIFKNPYYSSVFQPPEPKSHFV